MHDITLFLLSDNFYRPLGVLANVKLWKREPGRRKRDASTINHRFASSFRGWKYIFIRLMDDWQRPSNMGGRIAETTKSDEISGFIIFERAWRRADRPEQKRDPACVYRWFYQAAAALTPRPNVADVVLYGVALSPTRWLLHVQWIDGPPWLLYGQFPINSARTCTLISCRNTAAAKDTNCDRPPFVRTSSWCQEYVH